MAKLLNLDKLVKENKTVVLNGTEWILPNSLSVRIALKMQAVGKKIEEDPSMENLTEAYSVLYDIFKSRNANFMSLEKFEDSLDIEQYSILCNFIAGVEPETEAAPDSSGKKNEPEE